MMLDEQETEQSSETATPDAGDESRLEAGATDEGRQDAGVTIEAEETGRLEAGSTGGDRLEAGATTEAPPDQAAELAREREKATDYMQRWHRAQADLANYKRRAEQERDQVQKYGAYPLFLELLKMLDNFQRAFDTLPTELREFSWVQGVALSYMQVEGLLRLHGVTPLETKAGQPFDPAIHEAVTHEETNAYPDGTVTAEYQRGYKLHDRVLRAALVRVAKAKSTD